MWGARCSNGPPGLSLDGTDAGTFYSADSGLGHSPCSKKSFSGAGTLDVTGSGLRHSPYSEKSFMKEAEFDSETGIFELTGSGPGQSTYSKKSLSEAGTLDLTGSGLGLSPYSKNSLSEALDVTHSLLEKICKHAPQDLVSPGTSPETSKSAQ